MCDGMSLGLIISLVMHFYVLGIVPIFISIGVGSFIMLASTVENFLYMESLARYLGLLFSLFPFLLWNFKFFMCLAAIECPLFMVKVTSVVGSPQWDPSYQLFVLLKFWALLQVHLGSSFWMPHFHLNTSKIMFSVTSQSIMSILTISMQVELFVFCNVAFSTLM